MMRIGGKQGQKRGRRWAGSSLEREVVGCNSEGRIAKLQPETVAHRGDCSTASRVGAAWIA